MFRKFIVYSFLALGIVLIFPSFIGARTTPYLSQDIPAKEEKTFLLKSTEKEIQESYSIQNQIDSIKVQLSKLVDDFVIDNNLFSFSGAIIEGKNQLIQSILKEPEIVLGEFIVKFKTGKLKGDKLKISSGVTGIKSIDVLNKINGVKTLEKKIKVLKGIDNVGLDRIYTFKVDDKKDILSLIDNYKLDPNVEYAEPIFKPVFLRENYPNDPYFWSSGSWQQTYDDQYWIKLINATSAWQYADGSGVVIGYSENFDASHEELVGQMELNEDEIPGNELDDDSDGFVDNYYWGCFDLSCVDDYGYLPDHGTAGIGTILSKVNNGKGISGMAPGAKGLPANGSGNFISGLEKGARIFSSSVGGRSNFGEDMLEYIYDNGGLTFVAAGNLNAYSTFLGTLPSAINVGSVYWEDSRYWSSGWGDTLDVMAPGAGILAPGGEGSILLGNSTSSRYSVVAGTSFAAPITAGLGALLLSYKPDLTPGQLRYIILNSTVDKGDVGWDKYYGYGRIDVAAAFQIAQQTNIPNWDFDSKITYPRWESVVPYDVLDVVGVAESSNFTKYEIELCDSRKGTSYFYVDNFDLYDCFVVNSSSQQVSGGILASIDPYQYNLKFNNYYFLKLKIYDSVITHYKTYVTAFSFAYSQMHPRSYSPVRLSYNNNVLPNHASLVGMCGGEENRIYMEFDVNNFPALEFEEAIFRFNQPGFPGNLYKLTSDDGYGILDFEGWNAPSYLIGDLSDGSVDVLAHLNKGINSFFISSPPTNCFSFSNSVRPIIYYVKSLINTTFSPQHDGQITNNGNTVDNTGETMCVGISAQTAYSFFKFNTNFNGANIHDAKLRLTKMPSTQSHDFYKIPDYGQLDLSDVTQNNKTLIQRVSTSSEKVDIDVTDFLSTPVTAFNIRHSFQSPGQRVCYYTSEASDPTKRPQLIIESTQIPYKCGDADGSGTVTISDAVYLVNYIFAGGPVSNPIQSGDADGSGTVTISDVVYLVNYIFAGGSEPCNPPQGYVQGRYDNWTYDQLMNYLNNSEEKSINKSIEAQPSASFIDIFGNRLEYIVNKIIEIIK